MDEEKPTDFSGMERNCDQTEFTHSCEKNPENCIVSRFDDEIKQRLINRIEELNEMIKNIYHPSKIGKFTREENIAAHYEAQGEIKGLKRLLESLDQ